MLSGTLETRQPLNVMADKGNSKKLADHQVVVVCQGCGGSGAVANVARRQAVELARRIPVSLVSESFPRESLPGVERYAIRPWRFGWLRRFAHVPNEIAFALAARAAVARLHARSQVAFVLCHGHPVAALAARPLRLRSQIPYGLVTHGDIFDRPEGTYDRRLTWFYKRTTPPAYRDADLVVALSPHMAELAQRGGARADRVVQIPNGIDPAEIGLDRGEAPIHRAPDEALALLYVGRLSVEKGVDILLDAAELLMDRGIDFQLRIVGGGPEQLGLSARLERTRLGNKVTMVGTVDRRALGPLYRSADVVCVPSRSDSLPTVVLEAMAAGVAVLGTDAGGIPYMVEHGVTGIVCARNSPYELADAIARLAADRESIPGLGRAARLKAGADFSWEVVGRALQKEVTNRMAGLS